MPSNHVPNMSMPIPSHLPQHQPPTYMLDGGVYQGQPLTTPSNDWNVNTRVKNYFFLRNLFNKNLDDWITIINTTTTSRFAFEI
jgi:hypothetical protein